MIEKKYKNVVLIPSWKEPDLLKVTVPRLLASLSEDSTVVYILNEGDAESVSVLVEHDVDFIRMNSNYGTSAIDFAIQLAHSKYGAEYITNSNTDMVYAKGWDTDLMNIIEENYPCSASCFLVERSFSDWKNVIMWPFAEFNGETADRFISEFEAGNFRLPNKMVAYSHPIMVKTKDFLTVGGYSHGLDMNWFPGNGLDDWFPYRLMQLHKGNFKFICSDKSGVLHGGSMTSCKLPDDVKKKSNWDYFIEKTGGHNITQFRQAIGVFDKVKELNEDSK